ncbi:MAG TPA: 50S ribosomal protein L14 [Patescibacteria group bacterium]|jgi:large subunit ribosomal protein L14|nr:50S ribosomal protein L14 [Patescibacteria group bacterium]
MIQKQTYLKIADNSGAKEIQCIHIAGSTRKRYAYLGDQIIGAVKSAVPGALVKKGDVVRAVIVRTVKEFSRDDGTYVRFGDNAAVIIKNDLEMVGTRIFGPVARELRVKFPKILGLAPESV